MAEAGWAGIGFVHADLVEAKNTVGLTALAKEIESAGLGFVEVEFLGDWWTRGPERERSDRIRQDLFEAAEVLGAQTIKAAGKMFSSDVDLQVMASEFDQLADEAKRIGSRIALEALPFTSFSNYRDASHFVTEVGNPNGGLIVDIWHVYRAGNTPEELLGDLNPHYIFAVELNDAVEPAPPFQKLWDDTINERRLPGEGDWDVPLFINVMRSLNYSGPWGVEILSTEHRQKSLHDQVETAILATQRVFREANLKPDVA